MNYNLVKSDRIYIAKNKFGILQNTMLRYILLIIFCGIITPGIVFAQTAENDVGTLQVEHEQYVIERTGDVLVKIFGNIEVDRSEGATLLLTQTTPDGKSLTHKMRMTDQGYYEFYFVHNWDSLRGNYEVYVSNGAIPVGNITYEVIQDESYKTDEQVKEEYFKEEKDVKTNLTISDYKTGFIIEVEAIEGSKIITVTGNALSNVTPITIMVLAPNGNIVSIDQLDTDSDGSFSTTINVGGPMWKQDGIYTITGHQGSGSLNKSTVEVEIADGVVIPEFGAIASLVLVVAISSIIILSTKSRLRF